LKFGILGQAKQTVNIRQYLSIDELSGHLDSTIGSNSRFFGKLNARQFLASFIDVLSTVLVV
jgi:hypothetical protein